MLTPIERQKLIEKLANFPNLLEERIAQINETQLDVPVRSGEWTAREIVHHLADAHLHGYIRMKLVLTESNPILKPYDQDAWAKLADAKMGMQPSLEILRGVHERWARVLQDLPESSWARTGVHLENGIKWEE